MIYRPVPRFLMLLATLGCRPDTERSRSAMLVDDLAQAVALSGPARRIVSLAPATTELLFAIGAGDRVVGRTRWCVYPPEVAQVTSVGDGLSPNIEVVAAQRPDLVVMYASPSNVRAVGQLTRLGIPSVNLRFDGLRDVPRAARIVARLTGDSARADSLATAFETELDYAAGAQATAAEGLRAIVIAWVDPPNVIGGGSFLTEMIAMAGGRNVFADVRQPSATVSIESIAARDPQVILVLGATEAPDLARRPEWQVVRAVRERRFVPIGGSEFSWPSFRAFRAVAVLRAAFAERAR